MNLINIVSRFVIYCKINLNLCRYFNIHNTMLIFIQLLFLIAYIDNLNVNKITLVNKKGTRNLGKYCKCNKAITFIIPSVVHK